MKKLMAVKSVVACAAVVCGAANAFAGTSWKVSGTTMTEQGVSADEVAWVFTVSSADTDVATVKELSSVKKKTVGTNAVLDFTLPIVDDSGNTYQIVGLAASAVSSVKTLTEVRLPETLRTIGDSAFNECTALTTVTPLLPATVTSIGSKAFNHTIVGGELVLSNPELTSLGSYSFDGAKITSADLSATKVTAITTYAFYKCNLLTEVKLPDTVQSIDANAFDSCSALPEIHLPAALTSVKSKGFASCSSLVDVEFLSCPTFASDSFASSKGIPARFTYPARDVNWASYVASLSLTTWDKASSANRTNYETQFPDGSEPVGYAKIGSSSVSHWLVPIDSGEKSVILGVNRSGVTTVGTVVPGYGESVTHTDLSPFTCTATRYGDDGDSWFECTGYRIDMMDATGAWVEGEPVLFTDAELETDMRTVTFDPPTFETYQLTWLWTARARRVSVGHYPTDVVSLQVPTPDFGEHFYRIGRDLAFVSSVAAGGPAFDSWQGILNAKSPTLNLTVGEAAYEIVPVYRTDWIYDSSAKTIADGYWTLPVTGSADALTVGKPSSGTVIQRLLDLQKPVQTGTIVGLAQSAFKDQSALEEVRLPDTLTTINGYVFSGCSNLKTITPFLPAHVSSIGTEAFNECSVTGNLTILSKTLTSIPGKAFRYTKLDTIDLSRSVVTSIGKAAFNYTTAVKLVMPKKLATVEDAPFEQTSQLAEVQFFAFPENGLPANLFKNSMGLPARLLFPAGDQGWLDFVTNHAKFVAWDATSASDRTAYLAKYPSLPRPLGTINIDTGTTTGVRRWAVPYSGDGTKIIFR